MRRRGEGLPVPSRHLVALRSAKERYLGMTLFHGVEEMPVLRLPTLRVLRRDRSRGRRRNSTIDNVGSAGKVHDGLSGSTCLHRVQNVKVKAVCPPSHWSHDTIGRGILEPGY